MIDYRNAKTRHIEISAVGTAIDAAAMIAKERRSIARSRETLVDIMVRMHAPNGESWRLVNREDGRHLVVEGKDKGYFVAGKEGLVFKEAQKEKDASVSPRTKGRLPA